MGKMKFSLLAVGCLLAAFPVLVIHNTLRIDRNATPFLIYPLLLKGILLS